MTPARRRTCDLDELAARARDCAAPDRPLLVGVSGLAASGTSTVAELLAERLGATAVRIDERLDLGDGAHPVDDRPLAPPLVEAHAALVADAVGRGDRDLVLEGRHLLHPDVAGLVDVRVWIDVDADRAAGIELDHELARHRAQGTPPPPVDFGWAAGSSSDPVPPPSPAERFVERYRPDREAHALFVPVGGIHPPVTLRFMDEVGTDFALWDPDNDLLGELEDLLPMPEELRTRLKAWCSRIDTTGSRQERRDFAAEGRRLVVALQQALGPAWFVRG